MANEIRFTPQIFLAKGANRHTPQFQTFVFDQAGTAVYDVIVSAGTSEGSLTSFGSVGTRGLCMIHNTDATNFVEWGFATGVYGGKLIPSGPPAVFYMNTATNLFYKADTAACELRVIVYEA